ncbi:MAG: RNA helicase [Betaproteobacteria bacterium]
MLKLEEIQKDAALNGMESGHVVRIAATEPVDDNALPIRELLMRADIDSWIKQQSMEGLEASREQDGDATGQPNNWERK